MRGEILIDRPGATGYAHLIPVQVEFLPDGGYLAKAAQDIRRMRETKRTGEIEWEHTSELEFSRGDLVSLSAHELEEAREFIRQSTLLCQQTRELITAS